MWLSNGSCIPISIPNCIDQVSNDECIQCQQGKYLHFGKCVDKSDLNCDNYNEETYYKDQIGCLLKENSNYKNCKTPKTSSNECLECNDGYILVNGECKKIEEESKLKRAIEDGNCIEQSSKVCVRCLDGYYKENNKCIECNKPCTQCNNATYCTGCDQYSNLVDGTCVTMNALIKTCNNMWPNNQGCISCKDGYYKSDDGRNCEECDISCKTCLNKESCITCNDNYYMIPESTYHLCKHFNESICCLNITQSGCLQNMY